jgi:hypothetical protein
MHRSNPDAFMSQTLRMREEGGRGGSAPPVGAPP